MVRVLGLSIAKNTLKRSRKLIFFFISHIALGNLVYLLGQDAVSGSPDCSVMFYFFPVLLFVRKKVPEKTLSL